MRLNELSPAKGAKKEGKRLGRGHSAGQGKTSGRGQKGQHSRSGGYHKVGFEGGQMPLQRRLPKVGFRSRMAKYSAELRLHELELRNPAERVSSLRVSRRRTPKGLDPRELRLVLEVLKRDHTRWYPLALTLALTGARWSEITALRWSDLDETRGVIRIEVDADLLANRVLGALRFRPIRKAGVDRTRQRDDLSAVGAAVDGVPVGDLGYVDPGAAVRAAAAGAGRLRPALNYAAAVDSIAWDTCKRICHGKARKRRSHCIMPTRPCRCHAVLPLPTSVK